MSHQTASAPFLPQGTVYGTLLNTRDEWATLASQMNAPPYKAAPKAPVLYIKTANTWSPCGSPITVPASTAEVEVGASMALVIGTPAHRSTVHDALRHVAGYVLVNDLSLPHTSFFRPPVKYKNLDGFLGIGPSLVPASQAGNPDRFQVEVRIDGALRQTVDYARLVRPAAQLLADVSEFMTLHPGDVLLLGCGANRPLARAGQRIDISAPGLPLLGTLSNTLVAEAA